MRFSLLPLKEELHVRWVRYLTLGGIEMLCVEHVT